MKKIAGEKRVSPQLIILIIILIILAIVTVRWAILSYRESKTAAGQQATAETSEGEGVSQEVIEMAKQGKGKVTVEVVPK